MLNTVEGTIKLLNLLLYFPSKSFSGAVREVILKHIKSGYQCDKSVTEIDPGLDYDFSQTCNLFPAINTFWRFLLNCIYHLTIFFHDIFLQRWNVYTLFHT